MGQGSPVKDLILVTIPMRHVLETYKLWNRQRNPGGPDKLLAPAAREEIIRGVLEGLFRPTSNRIVPRQYGHGGLSL
jgi:hypothetical protein